MDYKLPFHSVSFVVQLLSCVLLFVTPWIAAHHASLSFTISCSLLRHISIELMMSSNHLILCHLLPLLPSVFPRIRVFFNELAPRIRWPKDWNFSFSISLSNEYLGLISFRTGWFDLLAVQGTLKSLFQHHNLKALIIQCAAFFMIQLSHLYSTTGKAVALSIQTFVDRMMYLLFNSCLGLAYLCFAVLSHSAVFDSL